MTIAIRPATPRDIEHVCDFNRLLALETEGKTLDRALLYSGVASVLADASKGLYFLAHENDQILGQVGLTYEWSDWRNGWFWWLQSVYIITQARRRGVCAALIEHIRQTARADSCVIGIRLYVEQANAAAQAFYRAIGLAPTSYQVMEQYPL
jgi:ribosomal protein S18 acetylase RimI-like enzyme